MNNKMIKLAMKFLEEIKGYKKDSHGKLKCDLKYKQEVMNEFGEILAGNSLTYAQLFGVLEKAKDEVDKESFYKPSDILNKLNIKFVKKPYTDANNLLIPGKFYYHPRLQLTPPAPKLKIEDDGTITPSYEEEEFYLEIVDKLTIENLITYYYNKMGKSVDKKYLSRDIGAMEHMLKFWDVDFILYLIDEAFAISMDKGEPLPNSLLDIQKYDEAALAVYEARKNLCFEEGLDRVHSRRD